MPVVAETWDGYLNDGNGFHVKPEHAHEALENAKAGPVAEAANLAPADDAELAARTAARS